MAESAEPWGRSVNPSRVLHIISGLNVGGAETMLLKLLRSLDPLQVMSGVISLSSGGEYLERFTEELKVPVWQIPMPKGLPLPGLGAKIRARIQGFKPDLVCSWMYRANAVASWYVPRTIPLIWNVRHSLDDWRGEGFLNRLSIRAGKGLSRRPVKIIYNSRSSESQHSRFGYASQGAMVIANGFDLEAFKPQPGFREAKRREWGAVNHRFVVGIVGRFHTIKGHLGFVEAAGLAAAQDPRLLFVMAGKGLDSNNAELVRAVQKAGLEGRIQLLGPRTDLPQIYPALDLLVNSSLSEAFPNVIGEAMACGVPCAVTRVGDSEWIVGDTGIVVAPQDSWELSRAILKAAEWPQVELQRRGTLARERVASLFSLMACSQSFLELFKTVGCTPT